MRGYRDVIVVLDDPDTLGVRKYIVAGLNFDRYPDEFSSTTETLGYNMLISIEINESVVTTNAELIDAIKGERGNPFIYSNFTPEQLAGLKGPTGDAFVYSDFTQAQLDLLNGPTGATGPQGQTAIANINYKGAYSPTTPYSHSDINGNTDVVLDDDGNSYYCLISSTGNKPSANPTYWSKFVMQGSTGTQGITGKSAYQSAVSGGYTGTEFEFNEDLANLSVSTIGTTSTTVGGVVAGSNLLGKNAIQILETMLYQEMNPVLSNPFASLTASKAQFNEIGSIKTIDLNSTFNPGGINPQYSALSPNRAGATLRFNYYGAGITGVHTNDYTGSNSNSYNIDAYTILQGVNTWNCDVYYAEGVQPYSSKGNVYMAKLPAGNTHNTLSVYGVYPTFATSSVIASTTKQTLSVMNGEYIQFSVVSETSTNKQKVEIPVAWSTITGIQMPDVQGNFV
jgi:hypothetical protein